MSPDPEAEGAGPLSDPVDLTLLSPPPRRVPLSLQWHLLRARAAIGVGLAFVVVSLFFIGLFIRHGGNAGPWTFFPFIHLSIGLGLVIVPLVLWQRRVAILRHGLVAQARIVAVQNQGTTHPQDGASMVNITGPWEDFESGFAKALHRWTAINVSGGPLFDMAAAAMGCAVVGMGLFGVLFAVVIIALIWLVNPGGARGVGENLLWTLTVLVFTALFLLLMGFFVRTMQRMRRLNAGANLAAYGVEPSAHCRFVFRLPDGRPAEATAMVDLRTRLKKGQAQPEDVAIFLLDEPERALLLGGLWPPVGARDGEWAIEERTVEN